MDSPNTLLQILCAALLAGTIGALAVRGLVDAVSFLPSKAR